MSCAQARESLLSFKAKSLKLSLLPSVHVGVWTPGGPTGVFGQFCQPCRSEEAMAGGVGCGTDCSGKKPHRDTRGDESRSTFCTQCPKPTDHISWIQPPHLLTGSVAHRAAIPSTPGASGGAQVPFPPQGTPHSCLTFTGSLEEVTAS